MTLTTNELWLPEGARAQFTQKAPKPIVGEMLGAGYSGPGIDTLLRYIQLPGGGMLMFDLAKLTLSDFRQMRDHYQVAISLWILEFMLNQIDWKIECDRQDIADFITEDLQAEWPRLISAMATAFWSGFSPNVLQFGNDQSGNKVRLEKIKDLIPEYCLVKWKEKKGWAPPGKTPPKLWIFDGISTHGSEYPVPVQNSFWYPLLAENGDYYGRKLLRPAFPAYFFSQLMHLFSNRYFERFGEPLPIGRYPTGQDVADPTGSGKTISARDAMENIVRNIRNRAVVVLPSDREQGISMHSADPHVRGYEYDIEFLESQMRGADFERYMLRLDEEISLSLFTPVLMYRTSDVGSYNLGDVHYRLFLTMLNSIAGDMKRHIDSYIIDRQVDINFGVRAPRARWVFRKLGKDLPETLRTIVQAVIGGQFGVPDMDELSRTVGMEFHSVQKSDLPPPPPVDPNKPLPGFPPPAGGKPQPIGGGKQITPPRSNPIGGQRPGQVSLNAAQVEVVDKMVKRVRGQINNAVKLGFALDGIDLDLGYRRQLNAVMGKPDEVTLFRRVLEEWWSEYRELDEREHAADRVEQVIRGSIEALV